MKAVSHSNYGAPDVLEMQEMAAPTIGEGEVLIQVAAGAVTQGDRRLRSSDFPGVTLILGRMMFGLMRPKHKIPGTVFAGRVTAIAAGVNRFSVGDDVFGVAMNGAQAEYLCMPADGNLALMPEGVDYAEAAAIPYGAGTALSFLRDHGKIERGQRVLIVGAAGGVGLYAVQLARHFGADVTAVCGRRSFELVRELGADHVIDYHSHDFTADEHRYDIIFDTPNATSFARCRSSLTPNGRYLSMHLGTGVLLQMLRTSILGGPRAIFAVSLGGAEIVEQVAELVSLGAIRPVIDARFPLSQIREAHEHLESARSNGTLVLTVGSPSALALAAK
ncbi:MAG: NADPH:quinone reductase-like Zn-dependent oxidoreductase [Kiritimatiellia bacterium]|jgi:NADPH:quinone reductase-like Zn-dependent oxidoreductase